MSSSTGFRPFARELRQLMAAAIPFRRIQLAAVVVITLVSAMAELVTVGAVLPVMAIAASPATAGQITLVGPLLVGTAERLGVPPVIAAAILLAVAAVAATALRFALIWISAKFTYGLQQDLRLAIFGRALRQPYDWYLKQNSSTILAAQEQISTVVSAVLSPLVLAASSAVMAVATGTLLFYLDPAAATVAVFSVGLTYTAVSLLTRRRMRHISTDLSRVFGDRIRIFQETLGGIRDINLDRSQPLFEQRLQKVEERYRRMLISSGLITTAPRLMVEGISIVLIAGLAVWFSVQPGGLLAALPKLGAMALGAQRMLPMVQQVYLGWSNFNLYGATTSDVVALLRTPVDPAATAELPDPPAPFRQAVRLDSVGFNYGGGRAALHGIELSIARGERIGFVGKTGSGKSTLVDILMGLLVPTDGQLLVDGEPLDEAGRANWKAQIAHVPQAIFLSDDSIAANIAFGRPPEQRDVERIRQSALAAGLGEFLDQLSQGLDTAIGERGVRLSGGQRQRIGIARALYKQASVLVLDEATSALDDPTEADVMRSIEALDRDRTLVMIAHRLTSLKGCDRIVRLESGRITAIGSYQDIVGKRRAAAP